MDPPPRNDTPVSSPQSITTSPTSLSIPPSSYLTVPTTRPPGIFLTLPRPVTFDDDDPDLLLVPSPPSPKALPQILGPLRIQTPTGRRSPSSSPPSLASPKGTRLPFSPVFMSVYSASSAESDYSVYSNPPARRYQVPSFQDMSSHRITSAEKDQMILALQSHQINTLVELRRVEKAFAILGSSDVAAPMTAAWSYYVNSHSLLTELRGLTKNYPFSSECLDEAKRRVYADPGSNRSWNFCWLVLSKVRSDQLIPYYARYQASQPAMWGGRTPTSDGVAQLTNAFIAEWNWAIDQMLRHWDQPPAR